MMPRRMMQWGVLLVTVAWFLSLPLRDVFAYPQRISVLPNLETDATAYDAFARELAQTWHLASLPTKHPPGWMVLLAAVYDLFGHSYVAGKLVSWVALIVTVGLCAWLANRVWGRMAAVIAALLCASSPGLRAYVGTLQYEVVTAALFSLLLVLSIRITDAATRDAMIRRAIAAGLAGAALILTRETFVLVVPLMAIWIWLRLRERASTGEATPVFAGDENSALRRELLVTSRESARGAPARPTVVALLVVATAAAPALLWSALRSAEQQRLIVISDKAREVFAAGNNPLANGTYNEPLVGIGEPAGLDFIRAYPWDALRLGGRKLLYSFGILRDGWNVPHPASVWIWRATTGSLPLPAIEPVVRGGWLLAACLAALVTLGRRGRRRWWILPASVAVIVGVHAVTLASYRFTVPLLPALYVVASGPLALVARVVLPMLRTPLMATAGATLAAIVVAAQMQTWPLRATYQAADLEGLSASNQVDEISGALVRVADARRGERPFALLPDTYFPQGTLRLTARMRMTSAAAYEATPVARITLQPLNGRSACTADVVAGQIASDRFSDVAILCHLERDGPATLAVFGLGQADLALDSVRLEWTN
jgi:hypothetical protein